MATNNAVNQSSTGIQSLTSGGVFNGRTITAGTGISVSNGDGISGNPTITATGGFSPNSTVNLFDDFLSVTGVTGAMTNGALCWQTSGTIAFGSVTATSNAHPGILKNNNNMTGNSTYMILGNTFAGPTPTPGFILGGGAITVNWVMQINTLSAAGARYSLRMGLGDTVNGDQANGTYFEYSDNTNSGNWIGKTAASSTRSTANSSTAADTNWHNYQVSINAGATSISYFIDGVQIANSPLSTNIPTAGIAPFVSMSFVSGTVTSNSVTLDLFYMTQTLTSAR